MSDNFDTQSALGVSLPIIKVATRVGLYSGDANAHVQIVGLVSCAGADDAKTFTDIQLVTTASPGTVGLPFILIGNPNGNTLDVDDGTVAPGQANIALTLGMQYRYNNVSWVRGGGTPGHIISAASTNGTVVKGGPGLLMMLTASNKNVADRYLKVYDKATAPTVGTDVPKFTFIIPGNTAGAGTNIPLPDCGISFTVGIAIALTTGIADTDNTGVALNELAVNWATL